MSETPSKKTQDPDEDTTSLDELSQDGAGATVDESKNTFEPEEADPAAEE